MKNLNLILIWIWWVIGLILYFQNIIMPWTAFTPLWMTKSSTLIIWWFVSWLLFWYWVNWFLNQNKDENFDDEKF